MRLSISLGIKLLEVEKSHDFNLLVTEESTWIGLKNNGIEWEHFYASLASRHSTASTALKRLTSFSPKNHSYRANRKLRWIFKTENILNLHVRPIITTK